MIILAHTSVSYQEIQQSQGIHDDVETKEKVDEKLKQNGQHKLHKYVN